MPHESAAYGLIVKNLLLCSHQDTVFVFLDPNINLSDGCGQSGTVHWPQPEPGPVSRIAEPLGQPFCIDVQRGGRHELFVECAASRNAFPAV